MRILQRPIPIWVEICEASDDLLGGPLEGGLVLTFDRVRDKWRAAAPGNATVCGRPRFWIEYGRTPQEAMERLAHRFRVYQRKVS